MGKKTKNITDVWGWESPEARLQYYAQVSPRRKMKALEEMRQFVEKYGISKSRTVRISAGPV